MTESLQRTLGSASSAPKSAREATRDREAAEKASAGLFIPFLRSAHLLYRSGAFGVGWGTALPSKQMSLGRMLIALGLLVAALGVLISLGERLPIRLGHLPGDIVIRGKNSVFYFPLVTCAC